VAVADPVDTYDLTVEDAHEFVGGSFLVHNCVEFVEGALGVRWPVAMASQMSAYVNDMSQAPGTVGVSSIQPYGHTWINLPGGMVIDSNWTAPLTIGIHSLSQIPNVLGDINIGNPLGVLAAVAGVAGKSVGGMLGALLDGPLGTAKAAAQALGGLGGAIALGSIDTIGNALKASNFDGGGILPPGLSLALNGTGVGEHVLSPIGSGRLEKLLEQALQVGGQAVGDTHVHVLNPAPQPYQIAREVSWAWKTRRRT
jgi:hypothetical protein